jgi:hypothetical protein
MLRLGSLVYVGVIVSMDAGRAAEVDYAPVET